MKAGCRREGEGGKVRKHRSSNHEFRVLSVERPRRGARRSPESEMAQIELREPAFIGRRYSCAGGVTRRQHLLLFSGQYVFYYSPTMRPDDRNNAVKNSMLPNSGLWRFSCY